MVINCPSKRCVVTEYQEVAACVAILKVCSLKKYLSKGTAFHTDIVRNGLLEKSTYVGSALVSMYAKCGALAKAQEVLDELPVHNVVTWSALMVEYAQQGEGEKALISFDQMQSEGLIPDVISLICMLKVCGCLALNKGKAIHDVIIRKGLLGEDIELGNALLDMYIKCGALSKAQQLLNELPARNVVSWSMVMTGYAQCGQGKEAFCCFEKMQQDGLFPDAVTFVCILKACGGLGAGEKGKQIHDEIIHQGLLGRDVVLGNALVDMYVKCDALAKAQEVFNELHVRNVVTWNTLLAGYAQVGQAEKAVNCLDYMQRDGLSPDVVTFTSILKALGSMGATESGKQIHHKMVIHGWLEKDSMLQTALLDMYAKCGALLEAQQVLDISHFQDTVSWNALISGYAQQGQGKEALNCFQQMLREGLSPDTTTFMCMLNACSRSGLVVDGQLCLVNMGEMYGVSPDVEHHTSMIDLLGRVGLLGKAVKSINKLQKLQLLIDFPLWHTVLCACLKLGNVELARGVFEQAAQHR